MNIVIGEAKSGDEVYIPIVKQGSENVVNPGLVAFINKWGAMVTAHAGHLIPKSYMKDEQFQVLLKGGRICYVGNYIRGGLGASGEGVEINFRPEILESCAPYLPEFASPKLWPLLRKLAEKDLTAQSHKKRDDEI